MSLSFSSSVNVVTLISRLVFGSLAQLLCAAVYMFFVFYMMFVQLQSIRRLRLAYFRHFWSFIDLGIIGCSWAGVGLYVWRHQEIGHIGDLFRQTDGFVYVNVQPAVYIQNTLIYLLSFCCFFSTLKFLRLCQLDRRLSLFTDTVRHARRDLCSFLAMYSIVFMAFLVLFYLLFASTLASCSTLLRTAQMLFEMTLLKFDTGELIDASAFLGPFCFALFIFIVVFVCLSMFVSIISDSFRAVRDEAKLRRADDPDLWLFMLRKLQSFTGQCGLHTVETSSNSTVNPSLSPGFNRPSQWEMMDVTERVKYRDPIEQFPDKIDQLLAAFHQVRSTSHLQLLLTLFFTAFASVVVR